MVAKNQMKMVAKYNILNSCKIKKLKQLQNIKSKIVAKPKI